MSALAVLVVDDNLVLRGFVCEALEPLPLEVVEAASLAEGLKRYEADAPAAIVTDLDLARGETAWPLIERACSAKGGSARVIIYSGKVDAVSRSKLAALGVTRVIEKPSTMETLMVEVQAALADQLATASVGDHCLDPSRVAGSATPAGAEQRALERFGGNRKLYERFRRDTCLQIREDIRTIGAALGDGKKGSAYSIVHSLKSALALLGEDDASTLAAAIEHAIERDDGAAADADWLRLEPMLQALVDAC